MTLEEAKKIFILYEGSHFGLFRDDEKIYSQYKALNISKEMEWAWLNSYLSEIQRQLTNEIDGEKMTDIFYTYGQIIWNYNVIERLNFMIEFVKDFQNKDIQPVEKMLMTEQLVRSIEYFKDEKLIKEAKQIALKSFQKLLKETKEFKQENYPFYTKEKFVNRINNDIKKYKL